jgi:hypothetical protein
MQTSLRTSMSMVMQEKFGQKPSSGTLANVL